MLLKFSVILCLLGFLFFAITMVICFIFKLDPAEWLQAFMLAVLTTGLIGLLAGLAIETLIK